MQISTRTLHPSCVPTLALIYLLSAPSPPPPPLVLDALIEFVLACLYEDIHPSSLELWLHRVASHEPRSQSKKMASDIEDMIKVVLKGGLDSMHTWLNELKMLYPTMDDEDGTITNTTYHRTSPSALYIRKCRLTFLKLTFDDSVKWWAEFQAWCDGRWVEPDRRTQGLRTADVYLKAKSRLDYQAAKDATGYYDLDDGSPNQSRPQYALLNTAFLEYEMGGMVAARAALSEAVQVARRASDARCLIACSSLAKRLKGDFGLDQPDASLESERTTELVGPGRPSPTDLLWSIKRDSSAGEPLPLLIATLMSSRAMYQSPLTPVNKDKGRIPTWNDPSWEPTSHLISSFIWKDLGSPALSAWRETMALESLDAYAPMWHVRLPVLAKRATSLSRSCQFDEALKLLFRSVDTRPKRLGMALLEFRAWSRQVWDVVAAKAESKGQEEICVHVARLSPPIPIHWTSHTGETRTEPDGPALLQKGIKLLDQGQPVLALPYLLQSLRIATVRSFETLRLRCRVRLLQCRIEMSPTPPEAQRTLRELEEEWAQFLSLGRGADEDLLAFAKETKGRALVLAREKGDDEDEPVARAATLLYEAYQIYTRLSQSSNVLRVLALLGRFYDHLSTTNPTWLAQRNAIATEYITAAEATRERAVPSAEDWAEVREVEGIVSAVERAVLTSIAVA